MSVNKTITYRRQDLLDEINDLNSQALHQKENYFFRSNRITTNLKRIGSTRNTSNRG